MRLRQILIYTFLFLFSIKGGSQDLSLKAWIAVEKENDVNKLEARFLNNSNQSLDLKYVLQVEKTGTNTSSNSQSGKFSAPIGKELVVANAQINITSQDYFKALLLVFHNSQLVAKDSIEQGIKPTPPKKEKVVKKTISNSSDNLEIDGLIIDETRSKTARDFYDFFYGKWIAPHGAKDYAIKIKELPSRGRVARITVEVNDKPVFTRVLQPRLELIEDMSKQAINIVRNYLDQNESIKKDLGSDDQKGSGIF